MKLVLGGWFRLPRLGSDVFSALMKQGVRYDRELGFKLGHESDVESAVKTISGALGEDMELSLMCLVCSNEACPSCPYAVTCDRRKVSPICLCGEHARGPGAFHTYVSTFASMLAE
ncbi:MAG: hypothetical protein OK422_01245 [Thaumarchaeota archaeon]|nr:hypothetical protein [Nitrososphaerota archaeon]